MTLVLVFICLLGIQRSYQQVNPNVDCIFNDTKHGSTYNGNVSLTQTGKACVKWSEVVNNYVGFTEDHNYCRNPNEAPNPWCYTSKLDKEIGFCNIPYCECRSSEKDLLYSGYINTTRNGYSCEFWKNAVKYRTVEQNYCRTPTGDEDNDGGPWCYLTEKRGWNRCNIPICGGDICPSLSSLHLISLDGKPTYRYGEEAVISSCAPGYILKAKWFPFSVKCNKSGQWNLSLPICEGVVCQGLPNITDSVPQNKTSGYHYPDNITVTCNHGYIVNGTQVLRCQGNGQWSSPTPSCIGIPCPPFPNIMNAVLQSKIDGYRYPDNINVTCNHGYTINGTKESRCQNDGQWSVPSCIGVQCPSLPNILNAEPRSKTGRYRYPENIKVTCNPGYIINGTNLLRCQNNSEWSSPMPSCIALSESSAIDSVPIVGGVIGVVAILLAIFGFVLFLKRRPITHQNSNHHEEPMNEINNVSISLDSTAKHIYAEDNNSSTSENTKVYYNETDADSGGYYVFTTGPQIPKHAIRVEDFYDYVEKGRVQQGKIETEFLKLKSGLQKPTIAALTNGNKLKNKYNNMYAYDDSRVILNQLPGSYNSDYINASFVSGPTHIRKYIASQGPIDNTVNDFWRMVWQYDCGKIVMLTNVFEDGKQKCSQYWPETDKEKVNFGTIDVLLLTEDIYSDFTVRTLELHKENAKKRVIQFHYTAWPDKDVPKYASSLVHFGHKVATTKVTTEGPIIVHCSAGVGRTGTFIGLDYVVEQARELGYVDVFACVEGLRNQRVNMVQTQRQYVFLHEAILEALICPNSGIPTKNFPEFYKNLLRFDDKKKKQKLEIEFELMNRISQRYDEVLFEKGKSLENKKKNRYSNILPVGPEMPMLSTVVERQNEYINAVFLPGYRDSKAFIITQMPLESTIIDLWRLVLDYDIQTIVMLNQNSQTEEIPYWPETNTPIHVGHFRIEQTSKEVTELFDCISLLMQYKNKSKFWDDYDVVPKSPNDVFAFMREIENSHDGIWRGPIIVHCLNGCDKSGLYCVLATVIERLRNEQIVDIQHIIKQMRNRRLQIIPNYEQFQFLYKAVVEYLKQFETYFNFQ